MIRQKSIPMCIILSIVTCGIYGIIWFINLTDDTNAASGEPGTSGGVAFLLTLVTCGIYSLYWAYKQGEKLDRVKAKNHGAAGGSSGILYLILCLLGLNIIVYALMQDTLNMYAC